MRISDWSSDVCSSDLAVVQRRFQCAYHRRADRNHPATGLARMRNLIAQLRTDIQPFAVHAMLVQRFHPHRLKRAGADMQGDMAELHTPLAQDRTSAV